MNTNLARYNFQRPSNLVAAMGFDGLFIGELSKLVPADIWERALVEMRKPVYVGTGKVVSIREAANGD